MAKRLVLITGMSGSGKTTLAGLFRAQGLKVVTMGDVIRGLAQERGIEPTPANLGSIAKEIRSKGGEAAVAERCVERLETIPDREVVIDGIRSLHEVRVFKKSYDAVLVAVFASPSTRYRRLRKRGRSDDPADWETLQVRDERELGFNLGRAISSADHMVVNEGSLEDLTLEFERLLERLEWR